MRTKLSYSNHHECGGAEDRGDLRLSVEITSRRDPSDVYIRMRGLWLLDSAHSRLRTTFMPCRQGTANPPTLAKGIEEFLRHRRMYKYCLQPPFMWKFTTIHKSLTLHLHSSPLLSRAYPSQKLGPRLYIFIMLRTNDSANANQGAIEPYAIYSLHLKS